MPIAVRDRADLITDGIAAYIRVQADDRGRGVRAALFLVNGQAEPLDFVFSRATLPGGVLWRIADARRHATIALVRTLFRACPGRVDVLLARAEEVPSQIFSDDLEINVTCARLSTDEASGVGVTETVERLDDQLQVFWTGAAPDPVGTARRLVDRLARRGLLTEPFERAAAGLNEALGP